MAKEYILDNFFVRIHRKDFMEFIYNRNYQAVFIGILLLMIVFLSSHTFIKTAFFIIILLAANLILSLATIPLGRAWIGVEIITLSTVLTSIAYGPKIGMIMGALSALVNYIGWFRFSVYAIVEIPCYMVVGYLAFFFGGYNILVVGMIAIIFYNVLMNLLSYMFLGGNFFASAVWAVTNIVFNYFIFKFIASVVLGLMV